MSKGQILIELLLALAVATVTIVALAGVSTLSISNTSFSRHQSQAGNLASQALEWIRREREVNPNFNVINGSNYCLTTLAWGALGVVTCDPIVVDGVEYVRTASLTSTAQGKNVVVTVVWEEGGRTFDVKQTTNLYNY